MPNPTRQPARKPGTLTGTQAARQRGYALTDMTDGRCRARVELPPGPDGKRRQRTRILPTRDEANAWAQHVLTEARAGTHIDRRTDSFDRVADEWLKVKADQGIRPVTRRGYSVALKPARDAFGHKPLQDVAPADIRLLMRSLSGRAKATNRQTMIAVSGVFALACDDGMIRANPCDRVKPTGRKPKAREELTAADAAKITRKVKGDRLEAAWTLTLAGLRRSEVMALRWADFDLTAGTVTVARGRVDMGRAPADPTPTKSARGHRTLPLPPAMLAAVKRNRRLRQREVLALGAVWDEGAFIAVDEALQPIRPENYSAAWARLMLSAQCERPVSLHGARHGSVSRLLGQGVPVHTVAAWHGHDPSMTLSVYAHADDAALKAAGEALAL